MLLCSPDSLSSSDIASPCTGPTTAVGGQNGIQGRIAVVPDKLAGFVTELGQFDFSFVTEPKIYHARVQRNEPSWSGTCPLVQLQDGFTFAVSLDHRKVAIG